MEQKEGMPIEIIEIRHKRTKEARVVFRDGVDYLTSARRRRRAIPIVITVRSAKVGKADKSFVAPLQTRVNSPLLSLMISVDIITSSLTERSS